MDIATLDRNLRSTLAKAKAITAAATAEGRGTTEAEDAKLAVLLDEAAILRADKIKAQKALDEAAGIRSTVGATDGFKALAAQIAAGGKGEARFKDITQTDTDLLTTRIEPGIHALPADERYLAPVFTSIDPGSVLHVRDFRVTARGVTEGSGDSTVIRDPLATDPKAEADVTIEGFNEDMKLLAVMVTDVPKFLLQSEGQLSSVLEGEMRLQLRKALDAHVVSQIDAAGVPHGGSGSDIFSLVRSGINELALSGFKPDVVAISPEDAATIDELTALNSIPAWPFGCRVVVTPDADPLAPILIDTSQAGVLYQGGVAVEADPYSGFRSNTIDLRAEGLALMVVRRPGAILVADGSGS
jgi:hypothetical protein